jgi:hypothetical protein
MRIRPQTSLISILRALLGSPLFLDHPSKSFPTLKGFVQKDIFIVDG